MATQRPRREGPPPGLRPARLDDYEALATLFEQADDLHAQLVPAYFRRPKQRRAREEIARILRSPDEAIVVSLEDDQVVGLVHVQLYDTRPAPTLVPRRRAHVDSVVVRPESQRRGHGRRLVEEASSWARRQGAAELLLTVWAGNETAERFYEGLGFGRVNSVLGKSLS